MIANTLSAIAGYSAANFQQQGDFVADRERFSFAGAAVRTGKTFGAARQFADRVLEDFQRLPSQHTGPVTYWVIAPTYEEGIAQKLELFGEGGVIPDAMIDWGKQGKDTLFRNFKRGGGKVWLIGGRLIEFKSADKPESLVARKVRGVWWTEIARSKYAAWPNVRGRLSNYADSWLIADTSPMGRCWFFVELWEPAMRGEIPNARCHEWHAVHSPYIPAEEIELARATMPPEFFRRDYEASWATFQGQIYSGFDRATHMLNECPFKPLRWQVHVDLNTISDNPASYSVAAIGGPVKTIHGQTYERMHIVSEHEEDQHRSNYASYADSIANRVKQLPVPKWQVDVVIDPSCHRDFKAELDGRGLNYANGKPDVIDGIRTVARALYGAGVDGEQGAPLLTLDKSCTSTAAQFEGYAWKRNSKGVVVETPDKDSLDPHLLDGIRYGAVRVWSGFQAPRNLR